MHLQDLIARLRVKFVTNAHLNPVISSLQDNSRDVTPGSLFICLRGHQSDGHRFLPQALQRGAVAIVSEEDTEVPSHVTLIRVPDTRRAMAILADAFFDFPSSRLRVIGVTGTNGKTTTSTLIQSLLQATSRPCGLIGTIAVQYGDVYRPAKNTTPESLALQRTFSDMIEGGMTHAAMEVSSHALSMGRTRGTRFRTAVFTNLSQDHLDYHATMDAYGQAKGLLFSQLGNHYAGSDACAVLNGDDPLSAQYAAMTAAQVITYGIKAEADVRAVNVSLSPRGTSFTVVSFAGTLHVETPLVGEFNVYNLLAAISACLAEGIPLADLEAPLASLSGVSGRFETVSAGQPYSVIVDYAHTPDSLENVLQTARAFAKGRLICVVGCGGDRDKTKRPLMAAIAAAHSDLVVLTSDNPRTEDPEAILADMEAGLAGASSPVVKVTDRRAGIEHALHAAASFGPDDCVLIAGKGHETYQIIGSDTFHFDDREVVHDFFLRARSLSL